MPDLAKSVLPIAITLPLALAVLIGMRWVLLRRRSDLTAEQKVPRRVTMAVLTLAAIIAVVLALPIASSSRNQLIGLIGLLVSAMLALSSTNIMANAMAGILLRSTKRFRVGDYIRAGEYAGRVTERGLFDTEIQSELRELVSIPNTFLITNPVTTLRSSGALVTCELSLGFDVHHARIESLLSAAARETGLADPFVRIMDIGNFCVTYRVSGVLENLDNLLTTRSNLQRGVLDALHGGGVEIVSPTFMNTRAYPEDRRFIPQSSPRTAPVVDDRQDELVFDKAIDAEAVEAAKLGLRKEIESIEARAKESDKENAATLQTRVAALREQLAKLDAGPAIGEESGD